MLPDVIAMLTEGVTKGLTVMVIPDEVTVAGLAQLALDTIRQVITSPSESVAIDKVEEVSPEISIPFLLH